MRISRNQVVVAMLVMAATSLLFLIFSSLVYIQAVQALTTFSIKPVGAIQVVAGEATYRVDLSQREGLPGRLVTMRVVLYQDNVYVWGQNFDYSNREWMLGEEALRVEDSLQLPKGTSLRPGEVRMSVSGLIEYPRIGMRQYTMERMVPLEVDDE